MTDPKMIRRLVSLIDMKIRLGETQLAETATRLSALRTQRDAVSARLGGARGKNDGAPGVDPVYLSVFSGSLRQQLTALETEEALLRESARSQRETLSAALFQKRSLEARLKGRPG